MRWVAVAVAIAELIGGYYFNGVKGMLVALLFPALGLMCILFEQRMGKILGTGTLYSFNVPPPLPRIIGWVLIFVPTIWAMAFFLSSQSK